jgi:hypothetical protein
VACFDFLYIPPYFPFMAGFKNALAWFKFAGLASKLGSSDLPLNFHPAAIRASAGVLRGRTLDRRAINRCNCSLL